MISLIKSGAFDSFEDRKFVMAWYIYETCDKKNRITLQNMNGLIQRGLLPPQLNKERATFEFNRYLKNVCKQGDNYCLDERALRYLENNYPNVELIYKNNKKYLDPKAWDKVYQKAMNPIREWMSSQQEDILFTLNTVIFDED